MPSVSTGIQRRPPGRLVDRVRVLSSRSSDVTTLSRESDRPEVQEMIREAIRRGSIRVMPVPGCDTRVRIIRVTEEGFEPLIRESAY